jgi:heat shock protein HslJ
VAYRLDGDRLALVDAADAEIASLRPLAAVSLVGTWQLAELPAADGAIVLVDTDAFIELGVDGALTGNTGCNSLMGDHAVEGETIKVGPVATTKMACKDPAASEIETALLGALENAAGWRITMEGWLELVDASGALLAGFTPGTVSAA